MSVEALDTAPSQPDPRSPDGFSELVRLHHRELLVYALALAKDPHNAREIVQDAFVVAFEKIDAFDITRDFGAWMRGIVRNKWREWLRKNVRHEIPEYDLALIDATVADWQERRVARNSAPFDVLDQCLRRLPENLREAVDACYYRGETSDEASTRLGVAPAAIRKRLQRARDLLRECVERKLNPRSQKNPAPAISEEDQSPS